jgi:Xaa-Pro dipeptidase
MKQLFENRRDRLIELAVDKEIDILMVCDPINLLYFTGVKITPYERFIAFLMDTRSKKVQFVLPSLERDVAKDSGITAEFYGDQDDPFSPVIEFSGSCRRIGVEKNSLALSTFEKIADGLDHRTGKEIPASIDIGGIISDIRIRKDVTELEYLRRAARCSDEILADISAGLYIGQTEKDITFKIMQAMAAKPKLLIHDFVIQVLAGKGSADPHGYAGERILKKGDPVTIDFGVCFDHYWSDCCRTFFMGPPEQKFKEIYKIVLEAQLAAIANIRPGVAMSEIDLAARSVIDNAGYGECFIHRTGHGIGLSIHEPPSIHSRNKAILSEGMVFTIEPGIYLPGLGGVRIEEDIVVNAGGCEVLTQFPKFYADMVL